MIEWLNDWMIEWLNDWMIEWLNDWMIEWLNDWMIECHFYPFFEKKMTLVIVSSGIQSMVNGVYLFLRYLFYLMMMRFYLILMMCLI